MVAERAVSEVQRLTLVFQLEAMSRLPSGLKLSLTFPNNLNRALYILLSKCHRYSSCYAAFRFELVQLHRVFERQIDLYAFCFALPNTLISRGSLLCMLDIGPFVTPPKFGSWHRMSHRSLIPATPFLVCIK